MLVEGDTVLVKNFSSGEPWLPGLIYSKIGPSSCTVDLTDGRRVRRHLDQLRKNASASIVDEPSTTTDSETNADLPFPVSNSPVVEPPSDPSGVSEDIELRLSNCTRRPPQRFLFDIN